jgi:hypothetical protein
MIFGIYDLIFVKLVLITDDQVIKTIKQAAFLNDLIMRENDQDKLETSKLNWGRSSQNFGRTSQILNDQVN